MKLMENILKLCFEGGGPLLYRYSYFLFMKFRGMYFFLNRKCEHRVHYSLLNKSFRFTNGRRVFGHQITRCLPSFPRNVATPPTDASYSKCKKAKLNKGMRQNGLLSSEYACYELKSRSKSLYLC